MTNNIERGNYLVDDEVKFNDGTVRYLRPDTQDEGDLERQAPGFYDCEGRKLPDPKPRRHRKYLRTRDSQIRKEE